MLTTQHSAALRAGSAAGGPKGGAPTGAVLRPPGGAARSSQARLLQPMSARERGSPASGYKSRRSRRGAEVSEPEPVGSAFSSSPRVAATGAQEL